MIRRRQSGDYEYRFDAGFDPLTGQRRRPGRSGFKTKREAEQALRAAITAHEKGRSVRSSARTVGEFLEEVLGQADGTVGRGAEPAGSGDR